MGGKTGTGPDPASKTAGPGSDGCFTGLIFDPQGKARFTVVTYVNHGGFGGVNTALQFLDVPLQLLGLLLQCGQRGGQLTNVLVHLGRLIATQNGAERGWGFTAHVF